MTKKRSPTTNTIIFHSRLIPCHERLRALIVSFLFPAFISASYTLLIASPTISCLYLFTWFRLDCRRMQSIGSLGPFAKFDYPLQGFSNRQFQPDGARDRPKPFLV